MPTYEYQCTKCGRIFEEFQSITAKPKRFIDTDCQGCDNRAPVQRLIGAGAGLIFKGSGFYETDYRSASYKAGEKAAQASSTPSESKADKKDQGSTGTESKPSSSDAGKSKPTKKKSA